jgi:23S rRNA pseudouridine2605 synthase
VRKLFDAVGLTVSRLIRIRYGNIVLPKGLKRGVWVDLGDQEVRLLKQLTAAQEAAAGRAGGGERPQGAPAGKPGRGGQRPRGEAADNPVREALAGEEGRGKRNERGDRGERVERVERGPRQESPRAGAGKRERVDGRPEGRSERKPREERRDDRREDRMQREPGDPSRIPNPLLQTFDRRAAQKPRGSRRTDEDLENGPIPNPLEQTYDKRFVQGGRGSGLMGKGGRGGNSQRQPDPMQTSVGYIGADAFVRKLQGRSGGGGGGGGGGRKGRR